METQDGAPYEFLIEVVDRVADGYRLRVAFPDPDSPTGVGENRITAPFDPEDPALRAQLALLPTSVIASAAKTRLAVNQLEQTARDVGHRLFQALMVGETLGDLSRLRRRAQAAGADVRVSLRVQPPELAVLPWEYLFDARSDKREFLGRACMLTRSSGDLSPVPSLEVPGPLRVLAMVSLPGDQDALDVEQERRHLTEALAPMAADGRMELHWIPATKAALQAAVNQQRWHVFHYIGHGDFDAATGDGRLAFTGPDGGTDFVTARQLSAMFGPHPTLRLVVLNACQSAQSSSEDRQSGIAAALVHAGLAAVVAMQFPITDGAAPVFSGEFYATLAAGRAVDQCVRAGRTAITLDNANSLEWGTPVLYLRSADGLLFRQAPRQTAPETTRTPETAQPDPTPAEGAPLWTPNAEPNEPLGESRASLIRHLGADFLEATDKVIRKDFSEGLVRDLKRIVEGYEGLKDAASVDRARRALEKAEQGLQKGRGVRVPPRGDAVPPGFEAPEDEEEMPRSRTTRSASAKSDTSKTDAEKTDTGKSANSDGAARWREDFEAGSTSPTTAGATGETAKPFDVTYSSSLTMEAPVSTLALSNDAVPRLAVGLRNGVAVILNPDVAPGTPGASLRLHHQQAGLFLGSRPAPVRRIAFGGQGTSVACLTGAGPVTPDHVSLWDAHTGVPLVEAVPGTHFVYHPTDPGHFVSAGSWADLSLRRFDAPFAPLVFYPSDRFHPGPTLVDVAVSPDGRYVAAAGSGAALLCQVHDGRRISTLSVAPAQTAGTVVFSSDSRRLILPDGQGRLLAYRVENAQPAGQVPVDPSAGVATWAVGPTGVVVTLTRIPGGDGATAARFFHLDRPGRSHPLPGRFSCAVTPAFSPDGDFVALVGADQRTVYLFDVEGEL